MTVARFLTLSEITADVVAALVAGGAFKQVAVAPVSDYKTLLEVAANVAAAPKALICIGEATFDDHALARTLSLAIVVFSAHRGQSDAVSASLWQLIEAACAPFLPYLDAQQRPQPRTINGATYEPAGWTPIPVASGAAAAVEITVAEPMALRN